MTPKASEQEYGRAKLLPKWLRHHSLVSSSKLIRRYYSHFTVPVKKKRQSNSSGRSLPAVTMKIFLVEEMAKPLSELYGRIIYNYAHTEIQTTTLNIYGSNRLAEGVCRPPPPPPPPSFGRIKLIMLKRSSS